MYIYCLALLYNQETFRCLDVLIFFSSRYTPDELHAMVDFKPEKKEED